MGEVCPACGQRVLMRHGVRLSPRQADIFDMIEHSRGRGVPAEVLRHVFFADRPHKAGYAGVKAFIWQINEALAETDLRVGMRDRPYGAYRVERRAV